MGSLRSRPALVRAAGLPPTAGAAVMSTGILSTAAQLADLRPLSWALLTLAAVGELVLAVAVATRFLGARQQFVDDARTPASLTGVAATAVIGGGAVSLGWTGVAWTLLAVSVVVWLALLPVVLAHWRTPTVGASFLVCVATEGLAVLAAQVGGAAGDRPVVLAGAVAFLVGLVLYVVVVRFDWRQLSIGAGDHWVLAGALAITSLAGAELLREGDRLSLLRSLEQPFRVVDLVLWAGAVAGYGVLVGCELRWPRWRYDVRRWATVFPMGMTAASSFAVGRTERLPALAVVGHVLLWPALAAWVLTAAGAFRSRLHSARSSGDGG